MCVYEVYVLSHSVVSDSFVTPWTLACQAPLSMGFSRQEHWSGLPFPTLGDLPDSRIKPMSPASPALAGRFFTTVPPGKPLKKNIYIHIKSLKSICPCTHSERKACQSPLPGFQSPSSIKVREQDPSQVIQGLLLRDLPVSRGPGGWDSWYKSLALVG